MSEADALSESEFVMRYGISWPPFTSMTWPIT